MLVLTRRRGEWVHLLCPDGTEIRLVVVSAEGGAIRLGFDAPREVVIARAEVDPRTRAGRGNERREQP